MRRVYLDYTATTPVDPRVLEAMNPYFSVIFGNASSVHAFGREAKTALEKSRETIARAIGAQPGEIFFTGGGTESNNTALRGVAHAARKRGKTHIITSAAEHHAVLEPCNVLTEEGFEVTILPVDEFGRVSAGQLRAAMSGKTSLVSIMHANNEVGTISPIEEIASVVHEHHALLHTDAVQTLGKIPVDVGKLGVDLASFSAHKLYGPKGIGALYVKKGADLQPLMHGGGQERGKRPGTENVALAVGFAKAVELATAEMPAESQRLAVLRARLEALVRREFSAVRINGHAAERLPNILNISFDSRSITIEGEILLMNMDLEGIAVTSGSACTSGSMQPSHVLLAMGRDSKTAKATLRFAFGRGNTEEDVDLAFNALRTVVQRMTSRD